MAPGDGTMPSAGPPEVGEVAVGDNASMGRSVVEVLQEKKQVWTPTTKLFLGDFFKTVDNDDMLFLTYMGIMIHRFYVREGCLRRCLTPSQQREVANEKC